MCTYSSRTSCLDCAGHSGTLFAPALHSFPHCQPVSLTPDHIHTMLLKSSRKSLDRLCTLPSQTSLVHSPCILCILSKPLHVRILPDSPWCCCAAPPFLHYHHLFAWPNSLLVSLLTLIVGSWRKLLHLTTVA